MLLPLINEPRDFWTANSPKLVAVQPPDKLSGRRQATATVSPDFSHLFRNRNEKRKKPKWTYEQDIVRKKKEWKFEDFIKDLKQENTEIFTERAIKKQLPEEEVFTEIPLTVGGSEKDLFVGHLLDQIIPKGSAQFLIRRRSELSFTKRKQILRHHSYPSDEYPRGFTEHNYSIKTQLDNATFHELKALVRNLEEKVRFMNSTLLRALEEKDELQVHQQNLKETVKRMRNHEESKVCTFDGYKSCLKPETFKYSKEGLHNFDLKKMRILVDEMARKVSLKGSILMGELEEKDGLIIEQQNLCEVLTASLQAISKKTRDDTRLKFSLSPVVSDQSGFQEWARAMRMVARLPDGVPSHFRKNLWLSLAERHLMTKGLHPNWQQTERRLFSENSSAEDKDLSVQIVKDLHRTGCSLFCGATGQQNQAVLKRVLLAYARWNKSVGYCQGLNMLAALILQVMQGSQSATVKVMIYLIEGVLPESYFGNNLRGLSVDMAVFRDLLKIKLPELSKHLDRLQQDSKDSGTSYEPPLCDVFTMQWFLTLFSNCLPQATVLRVWDLVFLEGDTILLRTALAIWSTLSERMMSVRSADEFYSIMAVLTREMMEFGLMEANNLIKVIDTISVPEVAELREKYVYNISPWAVGTVAKMGMKLFYPDPYEQEASEARDVKMTPFSNHPDREKIALDISALKRQYWKLRERQRQAHIILSACRNETLSTGNSPSLNHLLLGKRALLSAKGRKIEGTVPRKEGQTLHWKDTPKESRSPSPSSSSSSSSSTELCDSSDSESDGKDEPKTPEEKKERRKSEIALLQILQENSEILQRIQSHRIDEPEDIREIRRKYGRVVSLDSETPTSSSLMTSSSASSLNPQPLPDLPRFSPFPLKSVPKNKVGVALGLYKDN